MGLVYNFTSDRLPPGAATTQSGAGTLITIGTPPATPGNSAVAAQSGVSFAAGASSAAMGTFAATAQSGIATGLHAPIDLLGLAPDMLARFLFTSASQPGNVMYNQAAASANPPAQHPQRTEQQLATAVALAGTGRRSRASRVAASSTVAGSQAKLPTRTVQFEFVRDKNFADPSGHYILQWVFFVVLCETMIGFLLTATFPSRPPSFCACFALHHGPGRDTTWINTTIWNEAMLDQWLTIHTGHWIALEGSLTGIHMFNRQPSLDITVTTFHGPFVYAERRQSATGGPSPSGTRAPYRPAGCPSSASERALSPPRVARDPSPSHERDRSPSHFVRGTSP
ncbi:hypothetical protein BCR44DRAFT_29527 [Catenaria anguillulae PL171]|uniref:Uncharacterized protein n=1 Tax=Catenaria anguillulae PL171 TaxID=765915 RepID=A0A1Y2HIN1_9FUNG|nr:hypothetical protein BCR44DRAFT_29527 [Catenaria anguillulae PL171]